MKRYTQEEFKKNIEEIRDIIAKYQEFAENSYITKETRGDIYCAGLKAVDGELNFLLDYLLDYE